MAEETLYCPSCNRKVRVPEELLGQPVQCPLCRLVFTAPVRGGQPPVPPTVIAAPPPAQQAPAIPGPAPFQPYGQPAPPVYPQPGQPSLLDPYQRAAAERLLRIPAILMLVTGFLGVFY